MTLLLFLIRDENDDGDSFDLMVWAEDREQAIAQWRQYFELDEDEPDPDQVGIVPHIPPTGPMAICWSRIREA